MANKDPAFLFYTSDFLTGTMIMTDTEIGQYIRLLCHQHQHGHFDDLAMQRLCGGNASALILAKFKKDQNGLFFNERLDIEVIKRREHAEKQRENANKRWQSNGNATAMPLENENEIKDVIVNDKKNGIEKVKKAPKNFETEKRVIDRYNLVTGSKARYVESNFKPIRARLAEGITEQDLYDIFDYKALEWTGTDNERYLTIETLCGNKAEKYRTQVQKAKDTGKTAAQIKGNNQNGQDPRVYKPNLMNEALEAVKRDSYERSKQQ